LEKDKDSKLALHMVKAKHEAKHYDYDSGKVTKKNPRSAQRHRRSEL
jgi:hypothetical protein